jgi:hypothetical protein
VSSRRIVFDTKLERPACVLLQVGLGGDPKLAHLFPTETWLLAPTPDMHAFPYEDWMLPQLLAKAARAIEKGTKP